jgi:hypothetical protein
LRSDLGEAGRFTVHENVVQKESFRLQRALRELQAVLVELGERRRDVRLRRSLALLQALVVELDDTTRAPEAESRVLSFEKPEAPRLRS